MSANIGKRLQEVRKRRGMTQRQLASESGVSLSLIRKLEQGERADTRLETARQLAQTLRVPTTSLIASHQDEPEAAAPGAATSGAPDGSAVNAAPIANSPKTGTIPELLLQSTATRGTGAFGGVSYIQRLNTKGGVAPTTACSGTDQISVPYSATYTFYKPAK